MKAIMVLVLALVSGLAHGAGWYWRPYRDGVNYGASNGTSYENAWDVDSEIDWTAMSAGDVLYVCGAHRPVSGDQYLVPQRSDIIISGACGIDPGSLQTSVGTIGETITIHGQANIAIQDLEIRNCWAGITLDGGGPYYIRRVKIHDCGGVAVRSDGNTSGGRITDSYFWTVGNGVYLSGIGHRGWIIENNHIVDVRGTGDSHGIGIQSCEHCLIRGNVIRQANSGITLYRIAAARLVDVEVRANVIREMLGISGSSGLNRGIEVTSANCTPHINNTLNVRIVGNLVTDILDAAIYVKVPDPDGTQSAVEVRDNQVQRATYSLFWNVMRSAEAQRMTPWFPVTNNDWGTVPTRGPVWVPPC